MSRRIIVLIVLTLVGAGLWLAESRVALAEQTVHIDLVCDEQRCEARVDDGDPLAIEIPGRKRATRLGLYAYHPWEKDGETYFRNLFIERPHGMRSYDLSLAELDHAGWFRDDGSDAWKLSPGQGLIHRGEPGSRGVALVAPPTDATFKLSVDVINPIDAGIAFRGYDAENIWFFVVRSAHNDAFFFRMFRGEPEAMSALMPLRELTVSREALRLAGLVGKLLCISGLFLLLLQGVVWLLGKIRTEGSQPLETPRPIWVRVTVVALFLATAVMCSSIASAWLHRTPRLADESAYLFQARVFASGSLWAKAPANPEFFEHEHLIVQGDRWFSKYPPMFSLVLALGVLLGVAWWVNPILAAITGWIVYRLGRELAGPWWGLLAWTLLLASPFFVVMGATYMSHMLAALTLSAFSLFLLLAIRRRRLSMWFAGGGCLSVALLTRPYTAFLVALAVAPFLAMTWLRERDGRRRWTAPAALLGGVLPGVALFLLWGVLHAPPGEASLNIYAQNEASDTLGFGADKGSTWLKTWGTYGHTPAKALRSAEVYLDYTADYLFGWPLALSFAFVLGGFLAHRRRSEAWALALIPLTLAVGHGFYWATQHLAYGARYWFAAVPALALLTVLGVRAWVQQGSERVRPLTQAVLAAIVLVFVGFNVKTYLPQRLHELPQFGGITANLTHEVQRLDLDGALVFVKTEGILFNDGFHLNDPSDPTATLFARDFGAANEPLLKRYPEREAWRWDGERLVPLDPFAERRP